MQIVLRMAAAAAVAALPAVATAADFKVSPELAKVIAAAKAEQTLDLSAGPGVLGGSEMAGPIVAGMKKAFGIDIEYKFTPGGPMGEIGNKVATEFRANQKSSTDAWTGAAAQIAPLLKLDMFHKVDWHKLYPDRIKPEFVEGGGVALRIATGTSGVLYNRAKGPEFGKIRRMEDMLKPEYKGKFGTTIYGAGFDVLLADDVWGADKTLAFYEKFVKNMQGILNCGGEDRIASGEFLALIMDCGGGTHHEAKYNNALAHNIVADNAMRRPYYLLIPKNAAHPNMAMLYGVFMSSPEGQKIVQDSWQIPLYEYPETRRHTEIAALEAKGYKFLDVTLDWWIKHPEIVQSSRKMFGIVRAATK
jgi:ABC-type Fe3+ transport system substrate-binding protein